MIDKILSQLHWYPLLLLVILALCPIVVAQEGSDLERNFDVLNLTGMSAGETLPDGWKLQTFSKVEKATIYQVIAEEGSPTPVIAAVADRSAAGMVRKLELDPNQYRRLRWRWKISSLLEHAQLTKKTGDDCAARVLVSFGSNWFKGGVPRGTLCYVRGSTEPVGTMFTSPYLSDVVSIVVASGAESVGSWETIERDLVEDYQRAFGEEPGKIRAISLMTDTDNTGSAVSAWYGQIQLLHK